MSISLSRPQGMLRRLLQIPTRLYASGFGWLLGHRFLMLTHLGRKTGKMRQTMLEVIFYDPARKESFVASGWGTRSDWYRNIQAQPALLVQTGRLRYRPEQHILSPQEVRRTWNRFRRKHPIEERVALWLYTKKEPGSPGQKRKKLTQMLTMVSFRQAPRQQ